MSNSNPAALRASLHQRYQGTADPDAVERYISALTEFESTPKGDDR